MEEVKKGRIAQSTVLFIAAFGAVSLIPTQIITMDKYLLDILFLVIVAFALVFYFKEIFIEIVAKTRKIELVGLIAVSLIIHTCLSYFILHFINQPDWSFDSGGVSFLLVNNFYLFVKPFDILVQQLLIILLVTKLTFYKMTPKQITLLFVVGFGVIHIFQTLKTDVFIGLGFTLFAILGAFIFPHMILNVRNGYLYNYMIHLGAYNLAALLAWTLY